MLFTYKKSVVGLAIVAALFSGCNGPKETGGTVLGALAGGVLGAQFGKGHGQLVGVGVGALLGSMAGGALGRSLDEQDKRLHEQALITSLNSNQPMQWTNPQNAHQGIIQPLHTTVVSSAPGAPGAYCREFQQTIIVGGKKQQAYGTACQQPDKSWKIVSTN